LGDRLPYNSQGPMQNENVVCVVKKLLGLLR